VVVVLVKYSKKDLKLGWNKRRGIYWRVESTKCEIMAWWNGSL